MKDKFIEVKLPGCVVFITATEMLQLLQKDVELWEKVLVRGKAFKRAKSNRERYNDHISKFYEEV